MTLLWQLCQGKGQLCSEYKINSQIVGLLTALILTISHNDLKNIYYFLCSVVFDHKLLNLGIGKGQSIAELTLNLKST